MNIDMFSRWRNVSRATEGLQHREKKEMRAKCKSQWKSWRRKRPKREYEEEKTTAIERIRNKKGIFQSHISVGLTRS